MPAAEIIGISDRQMRRGYERYREFGYDGLFDRRLGRPRPKRVPVQIVEQVLGLYRDRYFDLNVRHFCEKLREEHQVRLSYTWVKMALQGAGLVKKGRQRGTHRRRRLRRPLPGMLWHLDVSRHRWFQDDIDEFNGRFRVSGKAAAWKTKTGFPTPLGNPATPAGFPLSHNHGGGRLT